MVFLPLHDHNKLEMIPFQRVTVTLIALNCLVFLGQTMLGNEQLGGLIASFGFTPNELVGTGAVATHGPYEMPALITLFTYSFLHGDVWHLLGNMLFLWVFGDNVEDALGHFWFAVFYLLGGAAAGFVEAVMGQDGGIPLIGASGAVAATIGAYLLLYPKVRIWVLVLMRLPLPLPAYWVIGAWLLTQIIFIVTGMQQGVAWWAHLGGIGFGLLWVLASRPLRSRR